MSNQGLPQHLSCLVPSEWALWRCFVLRGAGFPLDRISALAAPECARAADVLISAEIAVEEQFQATIRELNAILDQLTAEGKTADDPRFKTVLNLRRRLADRKVPRGADPDAEAGRKFLAIEDRLRKIQQLRAEFENGFAASLLRQRGVLKSVASDPAFQEAVIWQNRRAFETGVRSIAESSPGATRNQHQRHHEELVASYLQRYSVKNDTIGFFGPVAWGRVEPGDHLMNIVPGAALLKRRTTYFEDWPIDKLAEVLSLRKGMDWWIPPRVAPHVLVQNGMLHLLGAPPVPLTALEVAVLPLCNGTNLPGEILSLLEHHPQCSDLRQDELRKLLSAKVAEGILIWRFLVPVEVNAENALRQHLLRIGDQKLRQESLRCLDQLEAMRRQVADSAGNPLQLCDALQKLETGFALMTESEGHRKPGTTYGGRTLVYEDCQRDLAISISPQLLQPAVPALSLLLCGLRWLVHSFAREFNLLFRQGYEELAAKYATSEMPLMDWWLHTEPRLMETPSLARLEQLFKQKWAEVMPVTQSHSPLQFENAKLKQAVQRIFPEIETDCPIRYYCPDLMLAGTPEAVLGGDFLYVLGEMHLAMNSLAHVALVEQHPHREELMDALSWNLPRSRFRIINTQEGGTTTVRTTHGVYLSDDYFLATTPFSVAPTGYQGHSMGGLLLRDENGEIMVFDPRESRSFPILDAFSDIFCAFIVNKAAWLQPSQYVPRVLLDKVVIHRETWRARARELTFAMEKEESLRFLGARKWMRSRGIPRRTFVRTPQEIKPFYLDLESPVLVEILCRAVRRLNVPEQQEGEITFSEMLPSPEQTWLQDSSGASYTSELRFTIVDLKTPHSLRNSGYRV